MTQVRRLYCELVCKLPWLRCTEEPYPVSPLWPALFTGGCKPLPYPRGPNPSPSKMKKVSLHTVILHKYTPRQRATQLLIKCLQQLPIAFVTWKLMVLANTYHKWLDTSIILHHAWYCVTGHRGDEQERERGMRPLYLDAQATTPMVCCTFILMF